MGLIFNMSVYDLGYIEHTREITLYPNYAEGCRVFCDTFLAEAQARCPVRTGYLRSTISASSTSSSITCIVGAEYAQYVEYGTSRQSAQPYFEPALQIALATAKAYWDMAEQEVIMTQRGWVGYGQILEEEIDNYEQESGPHTINSSSLSVTLISALFTLLFALVRALWNELRSIFRGDEQKQPDSNHTYWSSVASFISTF